MGWFYGIFMKHVSSIATIDYLRVLVKTHGDGMEILGRTKRNTYFIFWNVTCMTLCVYMYILCVCVCYVFLGKDMVLFWEWIFKSRIMLKIGNHCHGCFHRKKYISRYYLAFPDLKHCMIQMQLHCLTCILVFPLHQGCHGSPYKLQN